MKKLFAILLAVMLFASMATVVTAAENSKTTTLTTKVPAATYTLNIPADQEIAYGARESKIGRVTVTDGTGFASGKNVKVTINYTDFACDSVSTKIPFTFAMHNSDGEVTSWLKRLSSGESIVFQGNASGSVTEYNYQSFETNTSVSGVASKKMDECYILMNSADWGKALAGEYTATITFTAEVVVE